MSKGEVERHARELRHARRSTQVMRVTVYEECTASHASLRCTNIRGMHVVAVQSQYWHAGHARQNIRNIHVAYEALIRRSMHVAGTFEPLAEGLFFSLLKKYTAGTYSMVKHGADPAYGSS